MYVRMLHMYLLKHLNHLHCHSYFLSFNAKTVPSNFVSSAFHPLVPICTLFRSVTLSSRYKQHNLFVKIVMYVHRILFVFMKILQELMVIVHEGIEIL